MPNVTTGNTSTLWTASIAGMQEINRYLYNNWIFSPEIINGAGVGTGEYGDNCRPRAVNLSKYFGRNLQKGTTIYVPTENDRLVAQQKVEGVDLEPQTQTFGKVGLTVTSHTAVAVKIEDYQGHYNNIENYNIVIKENMLRALKVEIEERFFALATQATYSTGAGAGAAFSKASLRTVQTAFVKRNVPSDLKRYAIVTPEAYGAVSDELDEFQLSGEKGVKAQETGTIGRMLNGFSILSSNHVNIVAGAAKMMAFTDDTFMFALGMTPNYKESYNVLSLAKEISIDVIFAVAIKRPEYLQLLDYDEINV